MRSVFADTYYFLALLSSADKGHAKATAFTRSFSGRMLTTGWVVTELADALASTPQGRTEFLSTLSDLRTDPDVRIIPCDEVLMEAGVCLYSQRLDKKWSLTDCISFAVMRREGLTEALTGDRDFEQAGFVALLK
jgi:predicted nucleic acid-binding protein